MAWIMHPGNMIVTTRERRIAFSFEGISDGGAEKHNNMTHA